MVETLLVFLVLLKIISIIFNLIDAVKIQNTFFRGIGEIKDLIKNKKKWE